jgi:hypothetical protein
VGGLVVNDMSDFFNLVPGTYVRTGPTWRQEYTIHNDRSCIAWTIWNDPQMQEQRPPTRLEGFVNKTNDGIPCFRVTSENGIPTQRAFHIRWHREFVLVQPALITAFERMDIST